MNLKLHLRNVGLAGDRLKGAGFYHRIAAMVRNRYDGDLARLVKSLVRTGGAHMYPAIGFKNFDNAVKRFWLHAKTGTRRSVSERGRLRPAIAISQALENQAETAS